MNSSIFNPLVAAATLVLSGAALAAKKIDDAPAHQRQVEQEIERQTQEVVHLRGELERAKRMAATREAELTAPRGRIGVTLGQVHEALAVHLGLDAEEVILIESVVPGAAAAEAGVKAYDIITNVDGKSPVTQQSLREAVMAKEPGEELRLTVLRGGKVHEIDVPVQPAEERGGRMALRAGPGLQMEGRDPEELARLLNEMLESRGIDEEARRLMRERVREWSGRPRISVFGGEDGTWQRQREVEIWREGDQGVRMFMQPGRAPSPPLAFYRENVESHQQRMERMEQRLERIEKMLEQILESSRN